MLCLVSGCVSADNAEVPKVFEQSSGMSIVVICNENPIKGEEEFIMEKEWRQRDCRSLLNNLNER